MPKISVVLREAYADAGSMVMGAPKSMGADLTFALPIAQFAVEASELDYTKVYGQGIEEDAYEAYMDRSREKLDAFDAIRKDHGRYLAELSDRVLEAANAVEIEIDVCF